jgi:hypothetical protein
VSDRTRTRNVHDNLNKSGGIAAYINLNFPKSQTPEPVQKLIACALNARGFETASPY